MTRALQVNPETNFLESVNPSKSTFDSNKKLAALKLANETIDNGVYPTVDLICKALGVNARTFWIHLDQDPKFRECWKEIKIRIDSMLTSNLAIKANNKMGTLAVLALLKHNEAGKWNQDQITINHSSDNTQAKTILSGINDYIEADIIPETKQLDNNSTDKNGK